MSHPEWVNEATLEQGHVIRTGSDDNRTCLVCPYIFQISMGAPRHRIDACE